jgi:hypothetical protein
MPNDCRPPEQGGISQVEPEKRLQQWLQGRQGNDFGRDRSRGIPRRPTS